MTLFILRRFAVQWINFSTKAACSSYLHCTYPVWWCVGRFPGFPLPVGWRRELLTFLHWRCILLWSGGEWINETRHNCVQPRVKSVISHLLLRDAQTKSASFKKYTFLIRIIVLWSACVLFVCGVTELHCRDLATVTYMPYSQKNVLIELKRLYSGNYRTH